MDIVNLNHTYAFKFEYIDYDTTKEWMKNNWNQAFYYVGIYMALVFGGKHFMKSRTAFELRGPLLLWNLMLALFSICGTSRLVPELMYDLRVNGFYDTVCSPRYFYSTKLGLWGWMFILSKVPELGDTIFIVLRKQPLIFLHWYHHITVLLYTWYTYANHNVTGRWFMIMNYTVHSCMYTYYTFKVLKFRIPRQVNIIITLAQLLQMVVGCYLNYYVFTTKASGEQCCVSDDNVKISVLIYFSYFVLFLYYFYNVYVLKKSTSRSRKAIIKVD